LGWTNENFIEWLLVLSPQFLVKENAVEVSLLGSGATPVGN